MGLFTKLFGTRSEREIKQIRPTVDKILSLENEYRNLSEEALKAKTQEFKDRLAGGETLDDILPEAFAAVREAADRVLGMRPYPVQLIGGIVLHQGRIAEMKTGEGKTLVAILPCYLNALTGKGVHVAVRVVTCQIAMVEPKDLTSAEAFAELTLQCLFGGMACVAVRCKQAMAGGEQSAHTVTLDGTTLQHKVEAIHILAFHHSGLVQTGVYLIVQVGGKLHAPSVEAEVEMDFS